MSIIVLDINMYCMVYSSKTGLLWLKIIILDILVL